MIKVFVNNIPVLVPKNTSVLEACESSGIQIPRFCFHERLNVAGNCRMCLVEIEKAPKPIASCAYPVGPNMRIFTDTPLVQKARESVLEFLLINHPLDCPICDQGGECDLQDQTLAFGGDRSRFFYRKRGVEDKNCGPLIKTIMTRCIHCTRCVRFFQNVAGQEEFGTTARGKETEIGTYVGKTVQSELSGNIVDLCPVGALTSKPYAFVARPWELKTVETIDVSDAVGSNIKVSFKETEILRVLPVLNDSINEEWISDKTRYSFDGLKQQRIGQPFARDNSGNLASISWEMALTIFKDVLASNVLNSRENIVVVNGCQNDMETSYKLKQFCKNLNVPLIDEASSNKNENLMSLTKSNTTLDEILEADLCLLIGANPRYEASLYNVRLKKRKTRGLFTVASFGLAENLTYDSQSLGNSTASLFSFLEGKHPFCKEFIKAKKPFVVLGESILKRSDADAIKASILSLQSSTKLVSEDWFGFNVLPQTASFVGNQFNGVSSKTSNTYSNASFFFGVGLDNPEKFLSELPQDCFVALQTAFNIPGLKGASLILPGNAFTEKEGSFMNLEGRLQSTEIVTAAPNLARNNVSIIRALSEVSLGTSLEALDVETLVLDVEKNKEAFSKALVVKQSKNLKKITKNTFKSVISDFYLTNAISNNSSIMSKCSSFARKNYTNFI
jgi:NADH-quinone oxidoreductase chain G